MKVAVVGSGAWGTALAIGLCKNQHDVTLWTYEKDLIPHLAMDLGIPPIVAGIDFPACVSQVSAIGGSQRSGNPLA